MQFIDGRTGQVIDPTIVRETFGIQDPNTYQQQEQRQSFANNDQATNYSQQQLPYLGEENNLQVTQQQGDFNNNYIDQKTATEYNDQIQESQFMKSGNFDSFNDQQYQQNMENHRITPISNGDGNNPQLYSQSQTHEHYPPPPQPSNNSIDNQISEKITTYVKTFDPKGKEVVEEHVEYRPLSPTTLNVIKENPMAQSKLQNSSIVLESQQRNNLNIDKIDSYRQIFDGHKKTIKEIESTDIQPAGVRSKHHNFSTPFAVGGNLSKNRRLSAYHDKFKKKNGQKKDLSSNEQYDQYHQQQPQQPSIPFNYDEDKTNMEGDPSIPYYDPKSITYVKTDKNSLFMRPKLDPSALRMAGVQSGPKIQGAPFALGGAFQQYGREQRKTIPHHTAGKPTTGRIVGAPFATGHTFMKYKFLERNGNPLSRKNVIDLSQKREIINYDNERQKYYNEPDKFRPKVVIEPNETNVGVKLTPRRQSNHNQSHSNRFDSQYTSNEALHQNHPAQHQPPYQTQSFSDLPNNFSNDNNNNNGNNTKSLTDQYFHYQNQKMAESYDKPFNGNTNSIVY
ncbi:hypothetical protein SNEBB_001939 [Seison nebaliae]|nr:hypothetical protein SNEBB_001939 [Seison nebaliae]